tara:strand:+ start:1864 stop:2604 length:741 start_codon:yes stop_codon:yes gene_type:complete
MEYVKKVHVLEERFLQARGFIVPLDELIFQDENSDPIYVPNPDIDFSQPENISMKLELAAKNNYTGLIKAHEELQEQGASISFRLSQNILDWFQDAASIDGYFIPDLPNGASLLIDKRIISTPIIHRSVGVDFYLGHAWQFENSDYPHFIGVYGMKSALSTLLMQSAGKDKIPEYRKGIARKILQSIICWGKQNNKTEIIIPWPLEPMHNTLHQAGFKEFNTREKTEERKFLEPISVTSNYWVLNL